VTAGYTVLGTATSGQAARNLGGGAGIESRTVASFTWRLDHNALRLSDRHVLILDEGAMTSDVDLARLLAAVERSGAKLIVVGDDRQLAAIGPGGALTALAGRHPEQLWALGDNLRQTNPAERAALSHLRDGNLEAAVAWYARNGRVHPVPDRRRAVIGMIGAWAGDIDAGRDSLLLAYRRDNVEMLNRAARDLWGRSGRLTGPELIAPGGRTYRAGDRVVTLAPGPHGAWVTSQAAQVTAVDPEALTLTAITPDGRPLHMGPEDIGVDRLGYGYAITGHRAQGTTVEVAHVLDDGGGRELAYVTMSRAWSASHVYTTASDLAQAAQRLAWSWDDERRQQWATDQARAAERLEALRGEHRQLLGSIPPSVTGQLAQVREQQASLEEDLADLRTGVGRWGNTPLRADYENFKRPGEPTRRTSAVPKIPAFGSSPGTAAAKVVRAALPRCKQLNAPGSRQPSLTLGFSRTSGPCSLLKSASSKLSNKPEPTSSGRTLKSSTGSTNCIEPSKPSKPAQIAIVLPPGAPLHHHQSCRGAASGLPTSCRPRKRFRRAPSSEPDPTLMAPRAEPPLPNTSAVPRSTTYQTKRPDHPVRVARVLRAGESQLGSSVRATSCDFY